MTVVDLTTDQQSSTLDKPDESHQCMATIITSLFVFGTEVPQREFRCEKTATQQIMFTCCGAIAYTCDEHASDMPDISDEKANSSIPVYAATQCPGCGHLCLDGVCYHVVTTPI